MNNLPVVGIGASAGGLEAFEQFFRNVPADTGMAFVLVSHLDPNHASLLTEILQRSTALPIVEANDRIAVAPNHVYVIPPNRDMTILQGKLRLNIPDESHAQRLPIDTFLRSLAADKGDNAIGIVLSGTGTDGTLGLKAILDGGGVTFVQDPISAKYDGMPSNAIHAGCARFVLPVDEIAKALGSGTRSTVIFQETPPTPAAISGMNRILMQLRAASGHDFTLYKKSTINRRIEHRMSQHNIDDTDVYARYLKENPHEVHMLFKELLINVTGFFRDGEAFEILKQDILPELFSDKPADYVFRAWVAGCASGEEAYSIAILLYEWLEETHQIFNIQIFATDLDEDAIAFARAGIYPFTVAQDVTLERLHRFFVKEDAGYRINKEVRKKVMFALHNVISDPPFTKIDLLSCRNLMIYLEPELQQRLIPAFHYALRPGGVLFLSPAESIGTHTGLFSPLNRKWKFYRAIRTSTFSRALMTDPLWISDNSSKAPEASIRKSGDGNFAELTRRALLQFYAPASVVTDAKGNILFVFGETGKYLRPAPGQPTLNVIEMAREGLSLDLRAALHAAGQGTPTLGRELSVKTNGGFTSVSLSVRILPGLSSNEGVLLLNFQDVTALSPPRKSLRRKRAATSGQGRIEELERELDYTRENLQATIEEQQASNEELQSVNEELQSSNEELGTSKEELQSVNEELITVNAELQAKIEQLIGVQNDMKNLFDNINVGSIFLDEHLVIRRFTRDAAKIYRLVVTDVGRPLSDIKSAIEDDDLLTEARTVLDTLIPHEREVHITTGGWYLTRIQPYRTLDNVIEGVVLSFTDISARRDAEMAMQDARELAENIINAVREPLIVLEDNMKIVSVSRAFYNKFQATPGETLGRPIYELGNGQWNIASLRTLLENILQQDKTFDDYVVEHDFPGIGYRKMLLNARLITPRVGNKPLILLAIEDVT
ncbi:chemotaxis protein CheB [Candidatus Methylospira mobilis]|uniref:chemotaxis protein CheB n=1 Tax=Candidatus Methylospira mobilis TaxID=1808979 RepID=UPI0028EF31E8|nr:chemotaxis protein CheB [Candidatus Methylospira mobilis]WNV03927.1 chemotaxis protein CheB [Candidatus Methylospira mobilis]